VPIWVPTKGQYSIRLLNFVNRRVFVQFQYLVWIHVSTGCVDTQCVYFVTHVQNLLFFCCLDTDVQDKKLVVHDVFLPSLHARG
jgi:hypothetical protein